MAEITEKKLLAALSPCPNDTFIFHELVSGALCLQDTNIEWRFEDVETLNRAAFSGTYDISKLSFYAYLLVRDKYRLLRAGGALGFGCGPIAVSRRPVVKKEELPSLKIVLPGELTTAHLLFRLFCPEASRKQFVRYDDIIPSVKSGRADIGVIIHEDRFVFKKHGLHMVEDLGAWWERSANAPVPLGCIVMKHALFDKYAEAFDALVRQSITAARRDSSSVMPFVLRHAAQTAPEVVKQHIDTFVTDFSMDLGIEGDRAVSMLEQKADKAGVLP